MGHRDARLKLDWPLMKGYSSRRQFSSGNNVQGGVNIKKRTSSVLVCDRGKEKYIKMTSSEMFGKSEENDQVIFR